MLNKIKAFCIRYINIIPVVFAVLILGGFVSAGAYNLYRNKPNINPINTITSVVTSEQAPPEAVAEAPVATPEQTANEIKKNPPKTNGGKLSTKSVSTKAGTAVVVSTGGSSAASSSKVQEFASDGPTSSFAYVDPTGAYPNLGQTLKTYLETKLLHSAEISYLYEVDIIDCASCDYGGYWTGSYISSGSDITKAFGYITLNVGPYKNSAYLEDYMKLIFSHEYGHHYTMYHRWVNLNIPSGERFPAGYYNIRPLSYDGTAPDYSLGWGNCDAEVIADDYSYFYSGYSYHGSANLHGYPSIPATKTYLEALSGASPPAPAADSTVPSVSITSPTSGATVSGSAPVLVDASDNVNVSRVEIYIDGTLKSTKSAAPYSYTWDTSSSGNGEHTILARAFDAAGNTNAASITINVSNELASDDQKPLVTLSEPAANPFAWSGSNLRLSASATDNVSVVKIELYINDTLVASENAAEIIRIWVYDSTPVGSYTLKAKAYDAAGNWGESNIIINKL